ncbi:MAG: hypothetical protein J7L34_06700 [Thermotogaceae bacterium]|nr:hypothetical protein [Thermotogaceae bacterium]
MNKSFVILLAIFWSVFLFGYAEILSFVPKDFDVVILVNDASKNFLDLTKNVSFFEFVFSEKGLAFDFMVNNILNQVEKESRVSKDVFLDTISSGFLVAAKGIVVDANDLTSLDINFYIDLLKNIGSNSMVVFKCTDTPNFLKFLSYLIKLNLSKDDGYYIMQDEHTSIFAKEHKGYVVLSGSKTSIEKAVISMTNEEERLIEVNENVKRFFNESKGFILGFFKGDSFKVSMGINVEEEVKTDWFELISYVNENRFVADLKQYVEGNLEKPLEFLSPSDYMDTLPKYGNYYIGISVRSSAETLDKILEWFSGKSEDIDKLSDIVMVLLKNSSDKAYIMGDVSSASDVSYAALIKFNKEKDKELESTLLKYGAEKNSDGWIMNIGSENLFFYYEDSYMIISNITRKEYERFTRIKKLIDYPPYSYIKKNFPKEDILRVFIDIGDILYKTVGVPHNSILMFYQTYEKGIFLYRLEVM